MSTKDWVVLALAGLGALLLLISAFGLVRLRGVHQRMQAVSVGTTVGITFLLLSGGLHFVASAEMGLMILLICFFFATSPIATTAMARAAYRRLPHTTHAYLLCDDMANPAYTPDYAARAAERGAADGTVADALHATGAPAATSVAGKRSRNNPYTD